MNPLLFGDSDEDGIASTASQKASPILLNRQVTASGFADSNFELVHKNDSDNSDIIVVQPVQNGGNRFQFFSLLL